MKQNHPAVVGCEVLAYCQYTIRSEMSILIANPSETRSGLHEAACILATAAAADEELIRDPELNALT